VSELVLYQPPAHPWGMPNLSPFCIKLEAYLRLAQVPHRVEPANFRKAPKGKIPFVLLDGALVGDSQLVINELERRAGSKALDHGLGRHDAAIGHATRRMIEEGLYFISLYFRWGDPTGWTILAPEFRTALPAPFRILTPLIRRGQNKKLHAQGTGRHTAEEIAALGLADIDAMADLLGDQRYLLGDRPRTVDCTLYAFLESQLGFPNDAAPVRAHILTKPNLVAYRDRLRASRSRGASGRA